MKLQFLITTSLKSISESLHYERVQKKNPADSFISRTSFLRSPEVIPQIGKTNALTTAVAPSRVYNGYQAW